MKIWRRAYAVPPPPLEADDKRNAKFEDKYKGLPQEVLPATECLKDTVERGEGNEYIAMPFDVNRQTLM